MSIFIDYISNGSEIIISDGNSLENTFIQININSQDIYEKFIRKRLIFFS